MEQAEHEESAAKGDASTDGERDLVRVHESSAGEPGQLRAGGPSHHAGDVERAAERAEDGAQGVGGHVATGERRGHVVLVAGREHAPDHGDAESPADLQRDRVRGGADTRVVPGHGPHDGIGRRRAATGPSRDR